MAEVSIDTGMDATGASLVTVRGELDISNVESLSAALEPVLAEDPQGLVFDLSGLEFMDSAGIAVMVFAASQVPRVSLRQPSTTVRRVIEVSGLSHVLPVES